MTSRVSYIEACGTNYEIGYRTGECLKEKLISHNNGRQAFFREFSRKHNVNLAKISENSEKIISKHFPRYLEELKGLAKGASLSLREILLLVNEETILNSPAQKCTTFVYDGIKSIILGHNEDWEAGYEDKLYVVKAKPENGAAFISLAYLGCLGGSSVALNEYGVAFSGNSLFEGTQTGVPKNIILRSQIEAKDTKEFGELAAFKPRAVPNHSMAVDRKGNIVSAEVGLDKESVYFTSGAYIHTNHPIHKSMIQLEKGSIENSIIRYNTAKDFILNNNLDDMLAKQILRSHEKKPHTICIHPQTKYSSRSQTVASAIVNLSEMSLSVTLGTPCKSKYKKFYL
jgi:isopenicillin-N N-acyltransferase-like protein